MKKNLPLALLLWSMPGWGQTVTYNGNSAAMAVSSTSPITLSFPVTAGNSNLCLFVRVAYDGSGATATSLSATYNGAAMTQFPTNADAAVGGGTASYSAIFALANPSTGTNNLVISFSGSLEVYYAPVTYYNCNQSTPLHNHAVATGTNPSLSVTSAATEQVIAAADKGDSSAAISFSSCTNATCTGSNQGGGSFSGSGAYSTAVSASPVTIAFTSSGTNSVATGYSIQAAGGGSSPAGFNKQRKLEQMEGVVR